jgi:hypothetical protein
LFVAADQRVLAVRAIEFEYPPAGLQLVAGFYFPII